MASSGRRVVSDEQPLRVSFKLTDGVRITGSLTHWDEEGIDGSFGGRRWRDIRMEDVRKMLERLIDRKAAADWLLVARVMHGLDGAERWVERAIKRAVRIDPSLQPRVDEIRAEMAAERAEDAAAEAEAEKAAEAERLSSSLPEAKDWPAHPWPILTAAAQADALTRVRTDAETMLREVGESWTPIDATTVLVYSDLPRREAAVWARRLDLAYERLLQLTGRPPRSNIFAGKAVVFICTEREAFRLLEANAFRYLVPRERIAVWHPRGEQVYVCVEHVDDERVFGDELLRAFTQAYLHRLGTPVRLPPAVAEGLGCYLAAEQLDHEDGWPGTDAVGRAVGALFTEFLIARNPAGYIRWINALKAKADQEWFHPMETHYGMNGGDVVERFVMYYRFND